jgi:hypothetical protein
LARKLTEPAVKLVFSLGGLRRGRREGRGVLAARPGGLVYRVGSAGRCGAASGDFFRDCFCASVGFLRPRKGCRLNSASFSERIHDRGDISPLTRVPQRSPEETTRWSQELLEVSAPTPHPRPLSHLPPAQSPGEGRTLRISCFLSPLSRRGPGREMGEGPGVRRLSAALISSRREISPLCLPTPPARPAPRPAIRSPSPRLPCRSRARRQETRSRR